MSKKTLLVVDDSPTALMMNTMLLGRQPYNIVSAKDGQEAVNKALAAPPDLVVMDVMMPRMNSTVEDLSRSAPARGHPSHPRHPHHHPRRGGIRGPGLRRRL